MKILLIGMIIVIIILATIIINMNERLRKFESEAKQDYDRELMLHHKLFDSWEKHRYGVEFDPTHSDYEGEYYRLYNMERLIDDICEGLEDFKYLQENQEEFEQWKIAKKKWEEREKELNLMRK